MMVETDRLTLRPFVMEDASVFFELLSHPDVIRYVHAEPIESVAHAERELRDHPLADYQKYGFGRWACVLKETNEVIGFSGLKYLDELAEVDIGYRLLPEYWGRGLATEASRAAVVHGFDHFGLKRIIGLVLPENTASIRVLEKIGLKYDGMVEYMAINAMKFVIESDKES